MQFSGCNITFSVFQLSQGSAATLISQTITCHFVYYLTVKMALKYGDLLRSYRQNTLISFL